MSSELTKEKAFRTGHRNSAERKLESANEILDSLGDDPSKASKQRATLVFYKSSLREKLDVIQGLDKTILDLSTEEEIVSKIDRFCSHVELVLARLDEVLAAISPKIEANIHMSNEPTNGPAQSVSHVNIPSNDSPQRQAHGVGSQVKLLKLVLKKFNGDIIGGAHSGTYLRQKYIRTLNSDC